MCTCGLEISQIFIRTHKKKLACVAGTNERQMKNAGWRNVHAGSFVLNAAVEAATFLGPAGPQVSAKVFTGYDQPRFGRPEEKHFTHWVPEWIYDLLDEHEYELTKSLSNAPRLYGEVIAKAAADGTKRGALETALQLGGPPALRAFVETGAMRAERLLLRAQGLRADAARLEEEARNEDPFFKLG